MPISFRLAQGFWVICLSAYAGFIVSGAVSDRHASLASWIFLALCVVALVGLLRRVLWGRFLVSCFGVLLALVLAASLIPAVDCPTGARCRDPLAHLLGSRIPVWIRVLIVVVVATLVLLPLVPLGRGKDYFRRSVW